MAMLGVLALSSPSFAEERTKHISGDGFLEDSKIVIQETRELPELGHIKMGEMAFIQPFTMTGPYGWLAFVQQNINEQEPNYAR